MDETSKTILNLIGIDLEQLDGLFIPREQLISHAKYEQVKKFIPELKTIFSSSYMTSLQEPAAKGQKWPLLNLVRQILSVYQFDMNPVRKSDGYTPEGIKKYKRFFMVKKRALTGITKENDLE
jgi:hypothetical protein